MVIFETVTNVDVNYDYKYDLLRFSCKNNTFEVVKCNNNKYKLKQNVKYIKLLKEYNAKNYVNINNFNIETSNCINMKVDLVAYYTIKIPNTFLFYKHLIHNHSEYSSSQLNKDIEHYIEKELRSFVSNKKESITIDNIELILVKTSNYISKIINHYYNPYLKIDLMIEK